MTGFGKAQGTVGSHRIDIEISTLNSRFLDVFFSIPESLEPFEVKLREKIKNRLRRGRVRVRIWLENSANPENDLNLNIPFLQKVVDELGKVKSKDLQLTLDLGQVLRMPGVLEGFFSIKLDENAWKEIEPVVDAALDSLIDSQKKEGAKLEKEITKRLRNIEKLIKKIEELKDIEIEKQKEKAKELLKDTLEENNPETDQRLQQELTYWAMKLDVSEEIARIRSHISQFKQIIKSKEELKGRKLEFLCQELHREATTLSQKSFSPEIITMTIEIREEIERIREQVRNVV